MPAIATRGSCPHTLDESSTGCCAKVCNLKNLPKIHILEFHGYENGYIAMTLNRGLNSTGTHFSFGQNKFNYTPTGIILGMGSANERRHCYITPSLIRWGHTQHDPCPMLYSIILCFFSLRDQPNTHKLSWQPSNIGHRLKVVKWSWFIWVITVMSHECHSFSNHWRLDCLFNKLFRLTT